MNTKYQVLEGHVKSPQHIDEHIIDGYTSDVESAMDEYAKQQAIAFSQWLFKEGWVDFDGVDSWYNTAKKRAGLKTTEELHAQFIESQNKGQ